MRGERRGDLLRKRQSKTKKTPKTYQAPHSQTTKLSYFGRDLSPPGTVSADDDDVVVDESVAVSDVSVVTLQQWLTKATRLFVNAKSRAYAETSIFGTTSAAPSVVLFFFFFFFSGLAPPACCFVTDAR